MSKKILFIVTQSEFGGAQRYVYEVAAHLNPVKPSAKSGGIPPSVELFNRVNPQKYEVLVAAGQGDNELFKKLKNTRVEPVYLKYMKRAPYPWQILLSIWEIFALLKKEKPIFAFTL